MARRANRRKVRPQVQKPRNHETLEARVVMSADPLGGPMMDLHGIVPENEPLLSLHGSASLGQAVVGSETLRDPAADFWVNSGDLFDHVDPLNDRVEQTLNEANGLTGQKEVVSTYGFDGSGQTVVVIDSGIAYNHYALGGGVGAGYRVVGGWDFTENDADFYDDESPSGGHGTHVAGIIGAQGDGIHSGVATDVDLVGLRVFDDAGNGYFTWVEQALQWVHANRDSFDNPITAVNLSLGTEWNSDSVPSWSQIEDEFAQLEADGIFISVSAGNAYADYNANGVSYPAASDYVVPVMAVDNEGDLTYFSQRADYAIAAPGWFITSTVPDYKAHDGDSIDDDWIPMSGTSMAAPYVAGASVLIREAMEFVGQTGITQDTIYEHMMATGTEFYDSASGTYYKRLDLSAAIDALMPVDDYGSSEVTAYDLGTLNDSGGVGPLSSVSGVVSTLDDSDYFSFTAGATGVVTVGAQNVTHDLAVEWAAIGGDWTVNEAGDCVIDVVAGETYTFAISTTDGLGYYGLSIDVESSFAAIEWGALDTQETRVGLSVSGETWYSVSAGSDGYFTAETLVNAGAATVTVFDSQQNALTEAAGRVDYQAAAGESLLLRVTGESADFSLRMTNALSIDGSVATLVGTDGDDALTFAAGSTQHTVSLNGVEYSLDASQLNDVRLDGEGGVDSVQITGSSASESARIWSADASISSSSYAASAAGFESISVDGNGGDDVARMYDTAGVDAYEAHDSWVRFSGAGYSSTASDFDTTYSYSSGGDDTAVFYDSAGADVYRSYSDRAIISGNGFYHRATGFNQLTAYSTAGNDIAMVYDTAGDDLFRAYSDRVVMTGGDYDSRAIGFGTTYAYATTGDDTATAFDSDGNDLFRAYSDRSAISGTGYYNRMSGFDTTLGYASTGNDTAWMYDSAGDDLYRAYEDRVVMESQAFHNRATGFTQTYAFSTGGNDTAILQGSAGADLYRAYTERVVMSGDTFFNRATGFASTMAYSSGGGDSAWLYESALDDAFYAAGSTASVDWGAGNSSQAQGFDYIRSIGNDDGDDTHEVDAIDFALTEIGDWV